MLFQLLNMYHYNYYFRILLYLFPRLKIFIFEKPHDIILTMKLKNATDIW